MRTFKVLLVALLMALSLPLYAGLDKYQFENAAEKERFRELIVEIRCLVCQNQSLGDSDAELAEDLRREIYNLMKSGKNDQEIIDFLVARYGDFVLYKPPIKPETWLIWYGPFVFLAIAGFVVIRAIRKQSRPRQGPLTDEQQARIRAALDNEQDG